MSLNLFVILCVRLLAIRIGFAFAIAVIRPYVPPKYRYVCCCIPVVLVTLSIEVYTDPKYLSVRGMNLTLKSKVGLLPLLQVDSVVDNVDRSQVTEILSFPKFSFDVNERLKSRNG